MNTSKIAKKATNKIIADLSDRSGFDGVWDSLDKDIKEEIKESFAGIIEEEINKAIK